MFDRLIDSLEHRLAIDVRYALRGISWIAVGKIVDACSSLALALAFANLLSPETYGVYRYVLAVASVLAIPTLNGINSALIQAIANHKEGTIAKAFAVKLRFGLIGSLGALLGSVYYLLNDNIVLSMCFAIVALFIPLKEAFGLFDATLQGRQDFKRSSLIDALLQVTIMCGIVAVIVITKNVIIIIGAYFLLWTGGRALAWYFMHQRPTSTSAHEDARTISFGKHLTLMGAGGVIAQYADQILLFQNVGAAELALYSIAIAIPEQFKGSFKGIFALILPRYSKQSVESIRATIWYKARILGCITILMTIGYIALIPWALPLLFPKYTEAVFYSQLFALSFFTLVAGIFVTALQAQHKIRELYIFNIIQPIVQIVTVIIGVLWFGIIGAIVARVLTRYIMFGVSVILYQRAQ